MVWRCNQNRHDCMKLFGHEHFIVFDTETTGLHPEKGDCIIQLFAFRLHPVGNQLQILDQLECYIKPPFPIETKITEITGITNAFLSDKPSEGEVFDKIYQFFGNTPVLAAYNTKFDVAMMQAMYQRHGQVFAPLLQADILEMARDFVPVEKVNNFKQETIAKLYGVDKGLTYHNAKDDVTATARLLKTFHLEYVRTPEVNSYYKPKWIGPCYFLNYRRKDTGLYVYLTKDKRLVYNQYQRGWVMKGVENVGREYNMEYIQQEVLYRLGFSTVDELQKLSKKKLEDLRSLWEERMAM